MPAPRIAEIRTAPTRHAAKPAAELVEADADPVVTTDEPLRAVLADGGCVAALLDDAGELAEPFDGAADVQPASATAKTSVKAPRPAAGIS
jgi:hypothetical protein